MPSLIFRNTEYTIDQKIKNCSQNPSAVLFLMNNEFWNPASVRLIFKTTSLSSDIK